MNYTIAAKPTLHKSIMYRSRLEATWAAFFSLCGVYYQYEPFDLPGWSPDFQLQGQEGTAYLVEVKPVLVFPASVLAKIVQALVKAELATRVLLLGTGPLMIDDSLCQVLVSAKGADKVTVRWADRDQFYPWLVGARGIDILETWAQAKNELQFLKPQFVR